MTSLTFWDDICLTAPILLHSMYSGGVSDTVTLARDETMAMLWCRKGVPTESEEGDLDAK